MDKIEQGVGGAKRTLDFTYNAEGELWKVLDPENREVVCTYDDDGFPLTASLPDTTVVGLGFDDSGNLTPPRRWPRSGARTP